MFLPYTEGRAVRMLVALLAAADPLGRVDAGHRPDVYGPVASLMLATLRDGGRSAQIVDALARQTPARDLDADARRAANAFAAATMDWWASTERMLDFSVAS